MKLTTLTTLLALLIGVNLSFGQAEVMDSTGIAKAKKILELPVDVAALHRERMEVSKEERAAITLEIIRLRLDIATFESNKTDSSLASIESDKLKVLKQKERETIEKLNKNKDWFQLLVGIEYWPEEKRLEAMNKWREEHSEPRGMADKGGQEEIPFSIHGGKKAYFKYSTETDVLVSPPEPACKLAFDGWDETAQKARKDTEPKILFGQTDPKLEAHFPKRDFITCYGSLISIEGGVRLLRLDVMIASPKAASLFGGFMANDFIVIKMLDGTKLSLRNQLADPGVWVPAIQSVVYKGQYLIGLKDERLLRSQEVDSVIIRWTKAEDEFEIFEMDFFINQFQCLENG